jgi:hypothetical protein
LASGIKEKAQSGSIWEQGAEENILTEERGSDRKLEESA